MNHSTSVIICGLLNSSYIYFTYYTSDISFSYLETLTAQWQQSQSGTTSATNASIVNSHLCHKDNNLFPSFNNDTIVDGIDDVSIGGASSDYQYVFIVAQMLHGVGAAALITLGTTLMDESVRRPEAPMYIGIFEASFVLGPALG